jgi:predicted nucleic acid-binding protein
MMDDVVVVDADAIIAVTMVGDASHKRAILAEKRLKGEVVRVIYPVTAIAEAVTFMQRALSSGATARGAAESFCDPGVEKIDIDEGIFNMAVNKYFKYVASKKNTIFDCVVAAVADKYGTKRIFSFDEFYKKRGFKLVTEGSR